MGASLNPWSENAGFNSIRIFQRIARLSLGVMLTQSQQAMSELTKQVDDLFRPTGGRGLGTLINPLDQRLVGNARAALALAVARSRRTFYKL